MGVPGVKPIRYQVEQMEPLPYDKVLPYRAVVARANYLAAGRPDCQFASKELCRWMPNPTNLSLKGLKRLGIYLKGKKILVYFYPWQKVGMIDVCSDAGWAGCLKQDKALPGGCIMLGRHLIKNWSSTQSNISLSSGEAEFYGVGRASDMGPGYGSTQRSGHTFPAQGMDRQYRHDRYLQKTRSRQPSVYGYGGG